MTLYASKTEAGHNSPNPILVAFRENGGETDQWISAAYTFEAFGGYTTWEDPRSYFHAFTQATDSQSRHARKVLARLDVLA